MRVVIFCPKRGVIVREWNGLSERHVAGLGAAFSFQVGTRARASATMLQAVFRCGTDDTAYYEVRW